MPTISEFFGIVIRMYYDDHGSPHFHAHYGEYAAIIEIETLRFGEGELPRRAQAMVLEWARGTPGRTNKRLGVGQGTPAAE